MNILYVISGLEKGGAETQLFRLIEKLHKKHSIQVVSLLPGYYVKKLATLLGKEQVKVLGIHSLVEYLDGIGRLKKIIMAYSPDLVHSWLPHANILSKLACPKKNTTYLFNSCQRKKVFAP